MPKDLRVIYPSVACYKTSRVSSLSGSAVNSPQFRTSFTLPLRSLAKVDWKTNKNHLPVEFKGSLIYQVLGWPNNGNVWQVWGISPPKKWCIVWVPGWCHEISWLFWSFDEGFAVSWILPSPEPNSKRPENGQKNQKESFISQPPICRGKLFVSGRGQSTSHLFQVDKAYRGPRRCLLCQEVGLLTFFSHSNSCCLTHGKRT